MTKNATKRAFMLSLLSLLMCCTMLLGTTFAWFTDTVTSTGNRIVAGTLDVDLLKFVGDDYVSVADETGRDIFDGENGVNWEPGKTEIVYLGVANLGSLALKYDVQLDIEDKGLVGALEYAVINPYETTDGKAPAADWNGLKALANTATGDLQDGYMPILPTDKLEAKATDYFALAVHMKEDAGNQFQGKEITIDVTVVATQLNSEDDSFGSDYDKDAWVEGMQVRDAAGFQAAINEGYDVQLVEDIVLEEAIVVPAKATRSADAIVIDLNGKKITTAYNTATQKHQYAIDNYGNLVLNGGTIEARGVYNREGATLTVNETKIVNLDMNGGSSIWSYGGAVYLNNANLIGYTGCVWSEGYLEINGGSYICYSSVEEDGTQHTPTYNIRSFGELVINGGNFTSRHGLVAIGGTAQINGGTYTMTSIGVITSHVIYVSEDLSKVVINGGEFNCDLRTAQANGSSLICLDAADVTVSVYGGTYNLTPEKYVAEGYMVSKNADGKFTVAMQADTLNKLFTDVQDGGTVVLPEGKYTIPSAIAGKDITIEGIGAGTVMNFETAYNVGDANITFKNLHIQGKNANIMSGFGIQHTTGDIVYENCTFDGAVTNEYAGTVTYRNCTFTGTGYITTYAVKSATFENCVFDKADSRAVLVYSHGNNPCEVTLTGCDFKAAAMGKTWDGAWTAAVEIDTTNIPSAGTTVTITDSKADAMYSGIVRDKSAAGKANAVIVVDGNNWAFQANQLASLLTSDAKAISVVLGKNIDCPISSLGQITGGSGEYKLGGENTEAITVDLNGKKLNITTTYWSNLGAKNDNALFTIKNGSMTSSQASGTWNSYDVTFSNCDYVFENVTFDKAVAFDNAGKKVTMKNVTINETHDYYALWITATGQTVEIDGLTVNSAGRGIKIDEQYVDAPAKVTLKISNSKFTTAKKAAIMVKSVAGADITVENVDISAVAKDTVNTVWVDSDAVAHADKVTVTGATVINEP